VLTPRFIPRLTISADYINIKLKDAITNFSASQVLAACYDASTFPNNPFCALIRRNPTTNQLSFVNTSFFNADQLHYRGIVASWDYRFRTPFLGATSGISISGSYQRLFELSTKAGADNTNIDDAGKLGYPKNSAVLNVNYANGPFSLLANFNYTGSVKNVAQGVEEPAGFREHNTLNAVVYTNLGLRMELKQGFRVFADIENVFDAGVPYPVPANGGSVTYFTGVLGRYFRIGAGLHF
jgi:iron complex outermembrane receptor protein